MSSQPQPSRRAAQAFALLLTNAIKIVGLIAAFDQLLIKDHPTSLALGLSAFMIAGGQLSEGLILSVIDRMMGGEERHPPKQP